MSPTETRECQNQQILVLPKSDLWHDYSFVFPDFGSFLSLASASFPTCLLWEKNCNLMPTPAGGSEYVVS